MLSRRMPVSAWFATLALGATQAILPPSARAAGAEPTSAALLSVDLEGVSDSAGELPRAVRDAIAEHLAVVPQARIDGALRAETDPGCTTPQCAMRIAAGAGARWLVRARVAASGSD